MSTNPTPPPRSALSIGPALLLLLAGSIVSCDSSTEAPAPSTSSVPTATAPAATVGTQVISIADVDEGIPSQLAQIEMELYQARRKQLDQLIADLLLENEAKRRGVEVAELVREEIEAKASEPTDEMVQSFYDRVRAQGQEGTLEDLAPRIREALYRNSENQQLEIFLAGLRKAENVEISLAPPRIPLDLSDGFARGPEDAPITLVEFSDYQCPYCSRSQEVVKQVLERYGDRVRHVFMDFPLEQLHPQARAAAIAARCAAKQDRFWEYHEQLFAQQPEIRESGKLLQWAADLGLEEDSFTACLADPAADAAIDRSLSVGAAAGVSGTPGFFVNGILLKGAQPLDAFVSLIDDELARASEG